MNIKSWSMEWGGRTLSVETGKLALQAGASCTVRYGDTVILATATMSSRTREGMDYFPLMVNFEEKLYAAGKIKGSRFIKREGRPPEEAILAGRMIDRSIRPLFDDTMRKDVQVILTALSWDGENDAQIPGLVAASIALSISSIPWEGPIIGARVGKVDGEFVLNPTFEQRDKAVSDVIVVGTPEKIIMVEAEAKDEADDQILAAMKFGAKEMSPVLDFIKKIQAEAGKEKVVVETYTPEEQEKITTMEKEVREFVASHVDDWIFDAPKVGRAERVTLINRFSDAVSEKLVEAEADEKTTKVIKSRVKIYVEEFITKQIIEKEQRLDGRAMNEVRNLQIETGLLPRTHGTALFSRGDTQVLSVVTLGSPGDAQILDTMEHKGTKRYMHHYCDTPATYGEAGMMRGPGNRAIGHGTLAEKAILPLLPDEADFPYVVRVVSEVLGSNGSSSMASTCGSSLSLMDAGVPLKKAVAGIAMGLASDKNGNWKVITDLQDVEDGPGGMDFKIAGTVDGITAMQMDTKTHGLTWDIVEQTFKQSREARLNILEQMKAVIAEPKSEMSPYAPRIVTVLINPEKIRDVVGPGGKMINKIIDETGVAIDIEQDGRVNITSSGAEGLDRAVSWVKELTHEIEAGEKYTGTVVRLEDFGAFVNILPGKDGLVHVSDISWERTNKPSEVMKMGDKVEVVVKEVDSMKRVNLSIKALTSKPEGYVERPAFDRNRSSSGSSRGGNNNRSGGSRSSRPQR